MCSQCKSERLAIRHTDGLIVTRCTDCGHVAEERYGFGKPRVKADVEATQEIQG